MEELLLAVLPGFVPTVLPLADGVYLLNSNNRLEQRFNTADQGTE